MARARANGIEIEWDARGPADGAPMLLIMGLGGQLTRWSDELMDALAARGFRAIRYDNRDVGLSTKFDAAGLPDLARIGLQMMTGGKPDVAYTLEDMAADAVGLLDALGIDRAHVVGASMGGMIAQLVAARHPDRVLSLTSVMSTTGNPRLPRATPEANAVLMARPAGADMDALVAHGVRAARVIGSPGYPADEATLAAGIRADLMRQHHPQGAARQLAAIWAGGDRRPLLKRITAPTLVIHGTDDPLAPVEGGRDTAANIPGARLVEFPGMGHDLPRQLVGRFVDLLAEHAGTAGVPA